MNLKMLSLKEAQKRMGVSEWTMRRLVYDDPDFPTVKLGGRRMVNEDSLAAYIRAKEEKRELPS